MRVLIINYLCDCYFLSFCKERGSKKKISTSVAKNVSQVDNKEKQVWIIFVFNLWGVGFLSRFLGFFEQIGRIVVW